MRRREAGAAHGNVEIPARRRVERMTLHVPPALLS